MSLNIEAIQNENLKTDLPEFRAGDTVTVNVKVIEGTKERIQPFKGVVIQQKNSGIGKSITVRKRTYLPGQLPAHRLHRCRTLR